MCAASCSSLLLVVAAIKLFVGCVDTLVDLYNELLELVWYEVVLFRVDRLELAAINSNKLRPAEVQLLAQQREGAADLPKGRKIVLAKVGNRLVVRPELLQSPHQCDITLCLLLQAATRTEALKIAVEVEVSRIARGRAGAPYDSRHGTSEAAGFKGEVVEAADGAVTLATAGDELRIPYESIVRANLIDEG